LLLGKYLANCDEEKLSQRLPHQTAFPTLPVPYLKHGVESLGGWSTESRMWSDRENILSRRGHCTGPGHRIALYIYFLTGQTGRYVLIQTLRDKERQLLPHERPLEFLSKSGQYANDVHFILKRTGPSLTERPSSDSGPLPPERTFARSSLPLNPKVHSTEVTRSKEPKKSLTFNLGPMSSSDLLLKHRQKQQNSTVAKDSSPRQTSKDDIFKLVLQQQEQLKAFEMQNVALGKDLQTWERGRVGGPHEEDEDEVAFLERLIRRNESELGEEMFWMDELERERADEHKRQEKMKNLRTTMEDYTLKIKELSERTEALEKEIHKEASKRLSGQPSPAEIEEMVTKMKKEMETKIDQSQQLETNLSNVGRACEEAKRILELKYTLSETKFKKNWQTLMPHTHSRIFRWKMCDRSVLSEIPTMCGLHRTFSIRFSDTQSLRAGYKIFRKQNPLSEILIVKTQELEELNKDLRQCNLQQFIQQTGSIVTNGQLRPNEDALNEQSISLWEIQHRSLGPTESLTRLPGNHLMGHPRNLQNSLLSGRNPEGVYV
ncbi:hypothetical protein AB205_0198090, partial [Aquarana catesbeiana]